MNWFKVNNKNSFYFLPHKFTKTVNPLMIRYSNIAQYREAFSSNNDVYLNEVEHSTIGVSHATESDSLLSNLLQNLIIFSTPAFRRKVVL